MNERTRRQCPTCRLAKCFVVGMQKDLIRTDEERAARLQLVKANRLQRQEKLLAAGATNTTANKSHNRLSTSHEVKETKKKNFSSIYEFVLFRILLAIICPWKNLQSRCRRTIGLN